MMRFVFAVGDVEGERAGYAYFAAAGAGDRFGADYAGGVSFDFGAFGFYGEPFGVDGRFAADGGLVLRAYQVDGDGGADVGGAGAGGGAVGFGGGVAVVAGAYGEQAAGGDMPPSGM